MVYINGFFFVYAIWAVFTLASQAIGGVAMRTYRSLVAVLCKVFVGLPILQKDGMARYLALLPRARAADDVDVQVVHFLPAVRACVDDDAVAALWVGFAAVVKRELGG